MTSEKENDMKLDNPFHFDFADAVVLKEKLCPVSVGTVITGEPDGKASVTATQEDERIVLDFTIPRGKDGSFTTVEVKEKEVANAALNPDVETKGTVVTLDEHTFDCMPVGLYAKPRETVIVTSNDVTLAANKNYQFMELQDTNGHMKLTLGEENRYEKKVPVHHYNDVWRMSFNTRDPASNSYVRILHLPSYVAVPKGWVGEASTLSADHIQYRLKENTFYDIEIEHFFYQGGYRLTCNVDHSEPLIVTGSSAAAASDVMMSAPNSYVLYCTELSHSATEIAEAFLRGQDVYIRLSDPSGALGSTELPAMLSAEARVTAVYQDAALFGGYYVTASGEGNCSIPAQFYRLTVSTQDDQAAALVYAYLYNSAGM